MHIDIQDPRYLCYARDARRPAHAFISSNIPLPFSPLPLGLRDLVPANLNTLPAEPRYWPPHMRGPDPDLLSSAAYI